MLPRGEYAVTVTNQASVSVLHYLHSYMLRSRYHECYAWHNNLRGPTAGNKDVIQLAELQVQSLLSLTASPNDES